MEDVSIPYSVGLVFGVMAVTWEEAMKKCLNPLFGGAGIRRSAGGVLQPGYDGLNPLFGGAGIRSTRDTHQRKRLEQVSIPYSVGLVIRVSGCARPISIPYLVGLVFGVGRALESHQRRVCLNPLFGGAGIRRAISSCGSGAPLLPGCSPDDGQTVPFSLQFAP